MVLCDTKKGRVETYIEGDGREVKGIHRMR